MVQFFETGPSPKGQLSEILGKSLGFGLGNFAGDYFANKALQNVLDDKELANAPTSERLSKLQAALQPHGERGQRILQNQLMAEQQRMNEKEEVLNKKRAEVFRKRLNKEELTDVEKGLLSPDQELAIAKHEQAIELQKLKNQGKSPLGGLGGIPLTAQESEIIDTVLQQNPDATAEQLELAFSKTPLAPGRYTSIVDSRREANKPGSEFSKIREKSIADYVNNAITQGEDAENLRFTIETARKAIQGDVAGPGLAAIAKNNPYMQLLVGLTPDEAALQASNKKLLEGSKGIFGSKPTEREIFLLLNSMLPSIGKTKEANLAGLNFIERINDLKLMHSDIVNELTEGGTKYVPDLERQVNAKMRPYGEKLRADLSDAVQALNEVNTAQPKNATKSSQIKMKTPDGSFIYVPSNEIEEAKGLGAEIA